MSYSNDWIEVITFPAWDAGAAALANQGFRGPKGKEGRILDMGVRSVSEAFTAVTLSAKLLVGTTGDADAYALMDLGTTAIGDEARASTSDLDAIIQGTLPADAQYELTGTAATGGTPAGIGVPYIVVLWY